MRVPSATYRLQFHLKFRFSDAEQIVPYLHDLGISHLYASPRGKARKGSLHGYDVADPMRINSELGTEEEFARLVERLRKYDMGLLLDIVPNHMAASPENPWWMDVLENGRESPYASYFDIDWEAPGAKSRELQKDQVVLPILTDQYDRALFRQRIALRFDERGFYIEAEGNRTPVNPRTYDQILGPCLDWLKDSGTASQQTVEEFARVVRAAEELAFPSAEAVGVEKAGTTARAELKARLWELYLKPDGIRSSIDDRVKQFNGVKDDPNSFDLLDTLLFKQSYRLAHWRTATEEINYRRFFGLNDLVALRVEDPRVFGATHALIFRLAAENKVDGLRVDHIDGLLDPQEYLDRLQNARKLEPTDESDKLNIYTVVEKITSGDENLPESWRTAGTTGYDFLNAVNTLLIDGDGWKALDEIYRKFTGIRSSFADTWYARKRQVMEALFGSDLQVLSYRLGKLAALDPQGRDLPLKELIRALKEITARMPVYRTYLRSLELPSRDKPHLWQAIRFARLRGRRSEISGAVFDFFQRVFLLDPPAAPVSYREAWLDFLTRWQQFTGAVMAKGMEDTAFFVHHGLLSLNEVGTNPVRKDIHFGVEAFHQFNRKRLELSPYTLNTTSTHDTKWSEDVRARIDVLSEMPDQWQARLSRWSELNEKNKVEVGDRLAPTANEEVLLYQALLGVWPLGNADFPAIKERVETFLLKAVREAKTHSNWVSPNEAYETALRGFLAAILEPERNAFLDDFLSFLQEIGGYGACNAWAQLLLKMTSPGVPDFYQGNGLWQFQLTDPDNRSSVDYRERAQIMQGVSALESDEGRGAAGKLLKSWRDGRLKMYLMKKVLSYRRSHKELFLRGDYLPLQVSGGAEEHVCSFARHREGEWAITVVPRLTTKLAKPGVFPLGERIWGKAAIELAPEAPGEWVDLLTGQRVVAERNTVSLAAVFSRLPFALLTHEAD